MKQITYGVTTNKDLDINIVRKDTRTTLQKFEGMVKSSSGEMMMFLGIMIVLTGFTMIILSEILLLITPFYWLYQLNKKTKCPQHAFVVKVNSRGFPEKGTPEGIIYLGYEYGTRAPIIIDNDQSRAHLLVIGTTGSGKTRFLLGILYQSLMFGDGGSGCMYVDGKGDNTVLWFVYSFCQKVDRLNDLLVLNFITSDFKKGKRKGDPYLRRTSNTSNPFAYGDAVQLRSLISGLMRESGGDGDMWKGRAISMIGALLTCAVDLRDEGIIDLDVEQIRDRLPLNKIVEMYKLEGIREKTKKSIRAYLESVPGIEIEKIESGGSIPPKAHEQHGYLQMQFSEVLGDLAEVYGYIFSAEKGEIDYIDLVLNRRILFVILPSLEKDPDALAGLGKLVLAGVRSALAPLLGSDSEGTFEEVVASKPTNSAVPFFLILDEYGYYAIKGFAIVAAQARSLGVCTIFATQDVPSLEKGSKEEARAVIANTSTKIFMKLEDDQDTFKLAEGRGGQAYVNKIEGYEQTGNTVGDGYGLREQMNVEQMNRVNLRDMVSQSAGEAHTIIGDDIYRGRLFFADPPQVKIGRLNKFLMVKAPDKEKIVKGDVKSKVLSFIENYKEIESRFRTSSDYRKESDSHKIVYGLSEFSRSKLNVNAQAEFILGALLIESEAKQVREKEASDRSRKEQEEAIKKEAEKNREREKEESIRKERLKLIEEKYGKKIIVGDPNSKGVREFQDRLLREYFPEIEVKKSEESIAITQPKSAYKFNAKRKSDTSQYISNKEDVIEEKEEKEKNLPLTQKGLEKEDTNQGETEQGESDGNGGMANTSEAPSEKLELERNYDAHDTIASVLEVLGDQIEDRVITKQEYETKADINEELVEEIKEDVATSLDNLIEEISDNSF